MKREEAKLAQKERELKADTIWMLDRFLKMGQELIQKRMYLAKFSLFRNCP